MCFETLHAVGKVILLFARVPQEQGFDGRRSWLDYSKTFALPLRQLRKNPGFMITATTMLAVAICANSTVFGWINSRMLRPIPGARDTGDLCRDWTRTSDLFRVKEEIGTF
jgi:hypothetical protein